MRLYSLLKLALLPLLLSFSLLAHADKSYSNIFIFGDSLSDTGNLGAIGYSIPPPYFNKRFSNGPLAIETFTAKFGKTANASLHLIGLNAGDNYSVAGATASTDTSGNQNDLGTQITAFQASHGYIAPADALYVIFLGGNDIRIALRQIDPSIADSILQNGADNISAAIKTLYQMGANKFLVINAPNIALIPETNIKATAIASPEYVKQAEDLTKLYNKKLHRTVERIEDDEINITEFDLYKLFNKIVKKYSKFDFINNADACFSTISLAFHIDCNNGLNADQFIFFDEIHPTARVHTLFGEAFYKKLMDDNEDEENEVEELENDNS